MPDLLWLAIGAGILAAVQIVGMLILFGDERRERKPGEADAERARWTRGA